VLIINGSVTMHVPGHVPAANSPCAQVVCMLGCLVTIYTVQGSQRFIRIRLIFFRSAST